MDGNFQQFKEIIVNYIIYNIKILTMQLSISLVILIALQGCGSIVGQLKQSESSGDYNPLTLASVDPVKYKSDKALCFKQVESQTDANMAQNYNVVKFRECLIQKGYVLLS